MRMCVWMKQLSNSNAWEAYRAYWYVRPNVIWQSQNPFTSVNIYCSWVCVYELGECMRDFRCIAWHLSQFWDMLESIFGTESIVQIHTISSQWNVFFSIFLQKTKWSSTQIFFVKIILKTGENFIEFCVYFKLGLIKISDAKVFPLFSCIWQFTELSFKTKILSQYLHVVWLFCRNTYARYRNLRYFFLFIWSIRSGKSLLFFAANFQFNFLTELTQLKLNHFQLFL